MQLSRSLPSYTDQESEAHVARACLPQWLGTAPAEASETTLAHSPINLGFTLDGWSDALFQVTDWTGKADYLQFWCNDLPCRFPLKITSLSKLDKNMNTKSLRTSLYTTSLVSCVILLEQCIPFCSQISVFRYILCLRDAVINPWFQSFMKDVRSRIAINYCNPIAFLHTRFALKFYLEKLKTCFEDNILYDY